MDGAIWFKQAFLMRKEPANPARGAVLRAAREAKGAKLREVAAAIPDGVTTQAVSNWESGGAISMPSLIAACLFLEIDPVAASQGQLVPKENPGLAPPDATPPQRIASLDTGPQDVALLGVTVGGDDADFHFNGQVQGYVSRPSGLTRSNGIFALRIVGESAVPRFYPGEIVYCQRAPAAPGDYVVVELYPDNDDGPGRSYVKRLKRRGGGKLLCEQHNPPRDIEYDLGLVKEVYRIIPPNELFG